MEVKMKRIYERKDGNRSISFGRSALKMKEVVRSTYNN